MTRVADRRKVIELRKSGKTYSEIRRELGIPKSTLSDWLSSYPLTFEQLLVLNRHRKKNKELSIEKVRQTKRLKREKRLKNFYEKERRYWVPLNKRESELAGLFLYWGEGNKRLDGPVALNNTDPSVLKFTLHWLKNILKIPKEKIRVHLHLYEDMNMQKELKFWSDELNLPLSHFTKPYIKRSKRIDIDQKGFGHGTCGIQVGNVRLKERIMMAIKVAADYYSVRI